MFRRCLLPFPCCQTVNLNLPFNKPKLNNNTNKLGLQNITFSSSTSQCAHHRMCNVKKGKWTQTCHDATFLCRFKQKENSHCSLFPWPIYKRSLSDITQFILILAFLVRLHRVCFSVTCRLGMHSNQDHFSNHSTHLLYIWCIETNNIALKLRGDG